MIRVGRLLFLVLVLIGIAVGLLRLSEQQVPLSDLAATGLWSAAALAALFALLLGLGKLLGRLFGGDDG
ncbi:MAG: hypothetical protein LOD85_08170 [Clostridia bacterium]|nr:hypothetical protein [Bacillota bacterium]MBO2520972.1 hypothetical protein [Bacillota bacterium]